MFPGQLHSRAGAMFPAFAALLLFLLPVAVVSSAPAGSVMETTQAFDVAGGPNPVTLIFGNPQFNDADVNSLTNDQETAPGTPPNDSGSDIDGVQDASGRRTRDEPADDWQRESGSVITDNVMAITGALAAASLLGAITIRLTGRRT